MKLLKFKTKNRMKSFYIIALMFLSLGLKAQINTPSGAAHPFNSNAGYSYSILPTNLPSGGALGKSQDAANAYNTWKTNYVRACGSQYRVLFDDGSSTVSEGIGYGMLLAAYAADKPLFDGLWAYYKANSNGNGFMNWKVGGCSGATGTNGATDADEDAAMALIVAACQWPSGTYSSDATTLITAINRCEIDTKSTNPGQISNGDGWISCGASGNNCRNPSYMAPAYFKAFAAFVPSIASALNNVVTSCYTIVNNNANSSTGLVSNWSDPSGSPNSCNGPLEYGYESCRNPWRMATDVLWNNDTRAVGICTKIAGYVNGVGAGSIAGPVSMSGGTGSYHNATFISTFSCGVMGAGSSYQNLLNSMYSETVRVSDSPPAYFGNTLRCISLFMLSGNFWKPCGAAATTCTPPTATITAAGPTSFCAGGNVVLNANTGTGYTYQWNNNGAAITGANTASYTASAAGSYTVTVLSGTCSTTSAAVTITVNAIPTATITANGSTTFCSGGSVVLNAGSGNGYTYQWKNNGTAIYGASSASFTATASGSYTVVTTSNGCAATSSATVVTVNANPTSAITAGGPTSFCTGGNVVLNANTGNGYTYQWKNNGTAISGASAVSYTATAAGNYTVVVNAGACSATSSSIAVTVNPSPNAAITAGGGTTFCSGGNVMLNANTGNGFTYQWKNNGTVISGATAMNYTATTTGNYTLSITSGGCSATSSAIAVTVNPLPSATITAAGPTTFCSGNSVVLNATTGNGYGFQWNNNNTPISGATNASFTASTSGNYSVVVTASSCASTSAGVVVTVNANPPATITATGSSSFCTSGSMVLNANTGNGFTYLWKHNSTAISGAASASYTATASGSYTVSVSSNGCSSTSAAYTIATCPIVTGLNTTTLSGEFNVYPSPITSGMELELKGHASAHVEINITNMLGKRVWSGEENAIGDEYRKNIDISHLPSGIYFVTIKTANLTLLKKILKQ
jgi:hypothetical protein